MNNSKINEYCKKIRRCGSNINTEELKESFDIFVIELNQIDVLDIKYKLIEKILSSLINMSNRKKQLAECELISHELLLIFRDLIIINSFNQIKIEDNINEELLLNVCQLFMNLCYNMNDKNINNLKTLIFHQELINKIADCLNDISKYGKYLNKYIFLRSISFLLLSLKHFRRNQIITNEYLLITPILSTIIECLCSSYAIQMIKSLKNNFTQKLNDCQMLFLDTMPLYLQWYSSDYRDEENFIQILRILLNEYTKWLINCDPNSYLHCSFKLATMIRHLGYFLIRPIESENLNKISEEFYSDYCKLVLYWLDILSLILKNSSNDHIHINYSIKIIIQNFYILTLHLNVLNYMKTLPNLIILLLKMTDVNDDEVQLHTYRCLGKIMNESDIKTLANPDKIVQVYIGYIMNTIDDPKNAERFFSLLESLKNFVQHDQVKVELIKQNGLPLLFKCVLENHYDPIKVQLIALEILLSLSFNSDACFILKENENFLKHLHNLVNNNDLNLRRVAEGILWKLEKEEEAIAKPNDLNTFKYDIMISYSHRNQQICIQIHQQLIKDGYRVWIDRDCLRGSTMVGMANAIENSEYVLICMSTNYKQSVYCQSEAHYAFERGCKLIPIIIEDNYKPDGWLGIIVSGKIYINFINIDFKIAYERLKSEINQQRYTNSNQLSIKLKDNYQKIDKTIINSQPIQLISETIIDLPDHITQWTNDHVRSFLLRIGLGNTILPLCTSMNGHHLLQLYEICLINRESMYQSLKFELNERYHTLLPIADYIYFLQEIKKYIPLTSTDLKHCQSSFISLTFCNIL